MNALVVCLIIACCIVYIWDYTGFVGEFANNMIEILTNGKIKRLTLRKPFGCSLCMTTWITLIVLLIMDWRLAPMCLVYGWATQYILEVFNLIDNIITNILIQIERFLK